MQGSGQYAARRVVSRVRRVCRSVDIRLKRINLPRNQIPRNDRKWVSGCPFTSGNGSAKARAEAIPPSSVQ